MALAPDGTRGGRASRIAVFGIRAGAFDPISGGPERIAAARGPGSVRSGSRQTVRGLTFTGQCCAVSAARSACQANFYRLGYRGPRIPAP
jgi:hypothetical protein